MPNYRRASIPGGTFFFTLVTFDRRPLFAEERSQHTIQDEDDFEARFDDIHFNPVKHNYVRCPHEWEPSSFHRWVKKGGCSTDWACSCKTKQAPDFGNLAETCGEPC